MAIFLQRRARMRLRLVLPALISTALLVGACLPGSETAQYTYPTVANPCDGIALQTGHINGDAGFMALFHCLNDEGSLNALAPMINDLDTTVNPATGAPYLDDLVGVANDILASPDLGKMVHVAANMAHQGNGQAVLPVAGAIIDSGLAGKLLPIVQQQIDDGAIAHALPTLSTLLRDPRTPVAMAATKSLLDDGIANGWLSSAVPDVASMLTVLGSANEPALRQVLPPLTSFLAGNQSGSLVPVAKQMLDTGTVNKLLATSRQLYDQGILQQLGPDLRPLLLVDPNYGKSDLDRTLDILVASNGPLVCLGGLTVTSNLADMILSTMADQTPATVQNLVSILEATIGLGSLVCTIPQPVQDNLNALDALAKSGALDGMLPILKVFKAQNQVDTLVQLLVALDSSQALPPLEPVLISAIDAGVMTHAVATLPHLVNPDGTPTQAMSALLSSSEVLVTPTDPADPTTSPAAKLLPLLGLAGSGNEQAVADALYLLGKTMADPNSHFDQVLPALDAALAADPHADLEVAAADLIDAGTVHRALPMASHMISSGDAAALLPWESQLIHDGTAAALLQMLAETFDLLVN